MKIYGNFYLKIPLTKKLITLRYDVELDLNPEDLVICEPDKAALKEIYTYWNFTTWLKQLNENTSEDKNTDDQKTLVKNKPKYETISTEKKLDEWIAKLKNSDLVAIDTETTSLNYMMAEIVGISFSVTANHAAYVPLQHNYVGAPKTTLTKKYFEQVKTDT